MAMRSAFCIYCLIAEDRRSAFSLNTAGFKKRCRVEKRSIAHFGVLRPPGIYMGGFYRYYGNSQGLQRLQGVYPRSITSSRVPSYSTRFLSFICFTLAQDGL